MSLIQEALRRQDEEKKNTEKMAKAEAPRPGNGESEAVEPPAIPPAIPPSMAVSDVQEKKSSPTPAILLIVLLLSLVTIGWVLTYNSLRKMREGKRVEAARTAERSTEETSRIDAGFEQAGSPSNILSGVESGFEESEKEPRSTGEGMVASGRDAAVESGEKERIPGDDVENRDQPVVPAEIESANTTDSGETDKVSFSGKDRGESGSPSDSTGHPPSASETALTDSGETDTEPSPVPWPRLVVTGVLKRQGQGAVIVNNRVVGVGEVIMGAKLVSIYRQEAEFMLNGESRIFHIGQGVEGE